MLIFEFDKKSEACGSVPSFSSNERITTNVSKLEAVVDLVDTVTSRKKLKD